MLGKKPSPFTHRKRASQVKNFEDYYHGYHGVVREIKDCLSIPSSEPKGNYFIGSPSSYWKGREDAIRDVRKLLETV